MIFTVVEVLCIILVKIDSINIITHARDVSKKWKLLGPKIIVIYYVQTSKIMCQSIKFSNFILVV